ncbi:hypothetical protein OM076_35810 [Solirubrobacter ginsenosidimutans]|uniref:Uncharacterized protein n=1 Tax=Solirubrobacter ginsenosidimutans TaxID=490573 RepID=A0A9X3S4D6_9ACTN|nr:hypothetical protein [Solirubrobacter ginsenosidimutans]MDA0165689.1 hypothetical protein [Solirubrobacter ginsenosidimutans]
MTRQTEPPAGPNTDELAERRRRFRDAIKQIHAHQPDAALRTLAPRRWYRSGRP